MLYPILWARVFEPPSDNAFGGAGRNRTAVLNALLYALRCLIEHTSVTLSIIFKGRHDYQDPGLLCKSV